ncbi:Uncharacterised protein [uncultured archaeon]|nr:Uncharacterised protein [uncultured archaeon]
MKLQTPDFGTWMLKRWLYVFAIGACFMVMLVGTDMSQRLLAGLGLLVFMQLREISFVEDIDVARAVMRASPQREENKARAPERPVLSPVQMEMQARRDFAALRMAEYENHRPPSSY